MTVYVGIWNDDHAAARLDAGRQPTTSWAGTVGISVQTYSLDNRWKLPRYGALVG